MSKPIYHIGHGAYEGANRYAQHSTYAAALRELLKRGVRMERAQRALQSACQGSHDLVGSIPVHGLKPKRRIENDHP